MYTGGFLCFACGARGGDLVDFVMLRDAVSFRIAAQMLGAWLGSNTPSARTELRAAIAAREKARQCAEELQAQCKELRFEYRTELHLLHRCSLQAAAYLDRSAELTPEDIDASWDVLVIVQDEIRKTEAAYALLGFGCEDAIRTFTLHPEARDRMIFEVLQRGSVVDDDGHVTEVAQW